MLVVIVAFPSLSIDEGTPVVIFGLVVDRIIIPGGYLVVVASPVGGPPSMIRSGVSAVAVRCEEHPATPH